MTHETSETLSFEQRFDANAKLRFGKKEIKRCDMFLKETRVSFPAKVIGAK